MADENPKKTGGPVEGDTVIDNETLPAEVDSEEVADVFFDEAHSGVTGTALADEGRPQLFKLDHKKGKYHPWDDDEEKYDDIVGVIVNARSYYRRFGPSGVSCESDNGIEGYDQDLKQKISCEPDSCKEYSYKLTGNIQGQCGLGLQIQMVAMLDGDPMPLQLNMSATSARAFATYLKKLKRKKQTVRCVTTKLSSRFIKGRFQDYYAGKFEVEDEEPCVDISALLSAEAEAEKQLEV